MSASKTLEEKPEQPQFSPGNLNLGAVSGSSPLVRRNRGRERASKKRSGYFWKKGSSPLVRRNNRDRESIKEEVRALLEGEIGAEFDGAAAPEAVEYACQLIDQFPADCFVLPAPDVDATGEGEVYFEWMLEKDGRLLLTVGPDGAVASVCTFGGARSKNFGTWEDHIADLIAPGFARLAQIQQKERHG